MKTMKGNYLCVICKNRFWDEVDVPDGYDEVISICKKCAEASQQI